MADRSGQHIGKLNIHLTRCVSSRHCRLHVHCSWIVCMCASALISHIICKSYSPQMTRRCRSILSCVPFCSRKAASSLLSDAMHEKCQVLIGPSADHTSCCHNQDNEPPMALFLSRSTGRTQVIILCIPFYRRVVSLINDKIKSHVKNVETHECHTAPAPNRRGL